MLPRPAFRLLSILTVLFLSLLLCGGCRHSGDAPTAAAAQVPTTSDTSLTAPADSMRQGSSKSSDGIMFRDVASDAGVHYVWEEPNKRPLNILQTIGNGCAFLDYNNDGNLDILLVGRKLALFRGDGRGAFVDVTEETGLASFSGQFLGCAVGDYDNDGFSDLYVSGYRTGLLLHNDSGKRLRDVTEAMGLEPQPWGTSCGFADLDSDGFLDLFVANYVDFGPETPSQYCTYRTDKYGEVQSACGPRAYEGLKGTLYRNRSGNDFVDVTRAWGADAHTGKGLGVAFADFDGSGRVGFAIANDEVAGDLFRNEGEGSLKNVGVESGMAHDRDGNVHAGMGIDWGDYDNDGKLDLFVTTFRNEAKSLYRNTGDGLFTDVSFPSGIGQPALPYVAFGCKFLDAENDGWLDILIANGHIQDNVEKIEDTTYRQPLQFFRNRGGAPVAFEDVTGGAGPDLRRPIVGRGLAVGDYDNDGRVDALVADSEGKPLLLHNESSPVGNWAGFRLSDRSGKGNRDAYGAVVTVQSGGKRWIRSCHPGGSYLSSSDQRLHFGLGKELKKPTLESVTVRWPGGTTETWKNVPTGRYLTLEKGKAPRE